MKPISAEDKGMGMEIGKRNAKLVGMLFVLAALSLFIFGALRHGGVSIQDNDPSSYYVVVLLMILPFLVFSLKEDFKFLPGLKNALLGIVLFLAFFAVFACLRSALSFYFGTMEAFGIALPLLVAALVAVPFGFAGLAKLKMPIVYSIFTSPLLLIPVIKANNAFVNANAAVVYYMLKAVGLPLQKSGITITAPSAFGISIASTCAAIGAFIAILMFLVPIAYLYEGGSVLKKAAWVFGGIVLLFALNIARMFSIATIWFGYGLSAALSIYHMFAGQILFYIAIIIMFVVGLKIGFRIKRIQPAKRKETMRLGLSAYASLTLVLAIGILALFIVYSYGGTIRAPLYMFSGNVSEVDNITAYTSAISILQYAHMNISGLEAVPNGYLFALSNSTYYGGNSIFVIASINSSPREASHISGYNSVTPLGALILQNGITLYSYNVVSEGKYFHVDSFYAPTSIGNADYSIDYEFFIPESQFHECDNIGGIGNLNWAESGIYNLFFAGGKMGSFMCASYYAATGVTG
jgi:exosortase/archaeosortase family protein